MKTTKKGKELKVGDVIKTLQGFWRIYAGGCPVFKIERVETNGMDIDSCVIEPEWTVEVRID